MTRLWAAAASIAVFCAGLALGMTSMLYDLSHWNDTVAHAVGYGDLSSAEPAAKQRYRLAYLALLGGFGVTILVLAGLVVPMLRGGTVARVLVCATVSPYVLCCVFELVGAGIRVPVPSGHDETTPMWVHDIDAASLLLIVIGAWLTFILLLLLLLLLLPARPADELGDGRRRLR